MGLESSPQFISDLNAAWPSISDPREQGTNHIQAIKYTLQNTWPNVKGQVTASHTALNALAGMTGDDGSLTAAGFNNTASDLTLDASHTSSLSPTYRFLWASYMPRSGGDFSGPITVQSVSDWSTKQPIAASDGDGRYVQKYADPSAAYADRLAVRAGGVIAAQANGTWYTAQPSGDYATNTALNAVKASSASAAAAAQTTANAAQTAANAAQTTANAAIPANNGVASNLVVNFGGHQGSFNTDGTFSLSNDGAAYLVASDQSLTFKQKGVLLSSNGNSRRFEMGTASGVADGGTVSFKTPFSGSDTLVLCQNLGTGDANLHTASSDANGFTIHINNGGTSNLIYIAEGPV